MSFSQLRLEPSSSTSVALLNRATSDKRMDSRQTDRPRDNKLENRYVVESHRLSTMHTGRCSQKIPCTEESGNHHGAFGRGDGGGSNACSFRRATWFKEQSFPLFPNPTGRYLKRAVVAHNFDCYPFHKNVDDAVRFFADCGLWGWNWRS